MLLAVRVLEQRSTYNKYNFVLLYQVPSPVVRSTYSLTKVVLVLEPIETNKFSLGSTLSKYTYHSYIGFFLPVPLRNR
jgi:hypothetical protein